MKPDDHLNNDRFCLSLLPNLDRHVVTHGDKWRRFYGTVCRIAQHGKGSFTEHCDHPALWVRVRVSTRPGAVPRDP